MKLSTCTLRQIADSDAASLTRHANDRDIWLNLRDRFPHPYLLAHADGYIAYVKEQDPQTSFGIDVGGEIIGTISLVPGHDIERISSEIGYWIGREYWGRGIVTDALNGLTRHAFDRMGMERVFAVPFARNPASCRVLEKAGYVREGTMRRSSIKDGVVLDQHLYARYKQAGN